MRNLFFLFLFFIGMSLSSCGGCGAKDGGNTSEEPTTSESSDNDGDNESGGGETDDSEPKNLTEAMDQAKKAIEDSGMGNVEVVNFRDLQKHLPEKLAGMERTSKGGQTAGMLGMKVSTAEAKYKTDDGNTVEITLADTGGMGMGLMGLAAWSTIEVDREDENGSERTYTLEGNKAFEKIDKRNGSCELSVISKGRYVTTAKCRKCKIDDLKDAVEDMDLGDLPEAESK